MSNIPKNIEGKTINLQGEIEGAKKIDVGYVDNTDDAKKYKDLARLLVSQNIKDGNIPEIESMKQQIIDEGPEIRKNQLKNMPKSKPDHDNKQSINKHSQIENRNPEIPKYDHMFDFSCKPRNQNFSLVSIIGPYDYDGKNPTWLMRIWGDFPSDVEAKKYTEYIRRNNKYAIHWNIYAIPVGEWFRVPIVIDKDSDHVEYQNENLQEYHTSYLEETRKAREAYQDRINNAKDVNIDIKERRESKFKHDENDNTVELPLELSDTNKHIEFERRSRGGKTYVVKKTRTRKPKSKK